MSWSYDPNDLVTTTPTGRINAVRFLVGDTDTLDQLLSNEEIQFSLIQANDNVYDAACYGAKALAARFARKVDVELSEALSSKYSQLQEHYNRLADELKDTARKFSGSFLGFSFGGTKKSKVLAAENDANRVDPCFTTGQFHDTEHDYSV